jgi:hypothetical protein
MDGGIDTRGALHPATPRPGSIRPTPLPKDQASLPVSLQLALLAAVCVMGLGLATVGLDPGRTPLLVSILPPSVALAAGSWAAASRGRKRNAGYDRSVRALSSSGPPLRVTLDPEWGGRAGRLEARLVVRRAEDGSALGRVDMVVKEDRFDPRGHFWAYGATTLGSSVAFVAEDERAPLIPCGPLAERITEHPPLVHHCSRAVNELIGWSGERGSPPIAPTLPPPLASAAWPTLRRVHLVGVSWLSSCLLLPAMCIAYRPNLVIASLVTVAVVGARRLLVRQAPGWVFRPAVGALEELGWSSADARFGANALVLVRFGLALPLAGAGEAVEPSPAGWGYAPQPAGAAPGTSTRPVPGPSAPPSTPAWRRTDSPGPDGLGRVLLAVVLLAFGFLAVLTSGPSDGVQVTATVKESPTADGGVLLDVPLGSPALGGDLTVVARQSWETNGLDPQEAQVGDAVEVEVDGGCFCNPRLPEGRNQLAFWGGVVMLLGGAACVVAAFARRDPGMTPGA